MNSRSSSGMARHNGPVFLTNKRGLISLILRAFSAIGENLREYISGLHE